METDCVAVEAASRRRAALPYERRMPDSFGSLMVALIWATSAAVKAAVLAVVDVMPVNVRRAVIVSVVLFVVVVL